MNSPKKKGEIESVAQTQISPVYQNAIAITAEHYKTMTAFCKMAQKRALVGAVLSSCGASQFFTQDIEEIAGGVRR
jgi:hypothetical protein